MRELKFRKLKSFPLVTVHVSSRVSVRTQICQDSHTCSTITPRNYFLPGQFCAFCKSLHSVYIVTHEASVIYVGLRHEPGNQTSLSLYPKPSEIVSTAAELGELLDLRGVRRPTTSSVRRSWDCVAAKSDGSTNNHKVVLSQMTHSP